MVRRCLLILALVLILSLTSPRSGQAEESVDFKILYYQESDARIQVVSPSFLYQTELSGTLTLKIDGVYDSISGASPTGLPATSLTAAPLPSYWIPNNSGSTPASTPVFTPADFEHGDDEGESENEGDERDERDFIKHLNAVSGASQSSSSSTPTPTPNPTPAPVTSSSGGYWYTPPAPASTSPASGTVPVGDASDTRYAGNIELISRHGAHTPSIKLSLSTEDDYDSIGVSAKDSIDFDKRNTTITYGGSYNHDTVKPLVAPEETKDVGKLLVGVARVLEPRTSGKVVFSIGKATGFLNDPYKSVELNGLSWGEQRPSDKLDMTLLFSLLHYIDFTRSGVEATYRYYTDDFGINAHMAELVWNQELGDSLVVAPVLRYYQQTEADFYDVRFSGLPDYYSSDYRLSALISMSYGLNLRWRISPRCSISLGYERYEESGTDSVTDDSAYPSANIVSAGIKLWF